MNSVFIIRGFGVKNDSEGNAIDFDNVQSKLIQPALDACNLLGGTTTLVEDAGNIRTDMFEMIIQADLVLCDITVHNANVFYELGIRHSLRKKHTVLIKGSPSADETPFDLSTDRYLNYPVNSPEEAVTNLVSTIKATLNSNRETDSPIFLLLPSLSEADPDEITLTPIDFIEEVERAEAASDIAFLRVIAEDLKGLTYEREGLRRVGISQWGLKDWDGARLSWEKIKNTSPDDFQANLALANVYERQYRINGRESLLEQSNQAIRTVLESEYCSIAQRAEALALEGRNLKTIWRAKISDAPDIDSAQQAAIDATALQSYKSYKAAFECDLNAFYPGLAALQMGHMLQHLSEQSKWKNLFRGDQRKAVRFREDLEDDLRSQYHVVRAAIQRAQSKPDEQEPEWANVAEADLLLLTYTDDDQDQATSLFVQAYRDAIPPNKRFVWDASLGQLELYTLIGFKTEAVKVLIAEFQAIPELQSSEHLVVFAGHALDTNDSPVRFPAQIEELASSLIRGEILKLKAELEEGECLTVLASAAPGSDILLHEICAELDIPTRLCLPMEPESFVTHLFEVADQWRSRFHNIVRAHKDALLQMTDTAELPRWLRGKPGVDPWERGNRWVMQLAQSWGAPRVTLLVFWDGEDDGRQGGTAQFVRLARTFGRFEVRIIDSKQLKE